MTDGPGDWRELRTPRRPRSGDAEARKSPAALSPFVRLARVHALSAAGDGMIAVALAGSLFFSIDPSAARSRVLLYLLLTMAPFALVGPLIGPALDRARGGRRMMVVLLNLGRVLVAFFMIGNIDNLLLFPLAFAALVFGKGYSVAKAAIVPSTVRAHSELVEKNSRLAVLSGISGFVGAVPAGLLQIIGGPEWAVGLAMVTFAVGVFFSFQLPRTAATDQPDEVEESELRTAGIRLAVSATAVLRGTVGFTLFLIAFGFRGGADDVDLSGVGTAVGAGVRNAMGFAVDSDADLPAWKLGIVVVFSVGGALAGSFLAPRIRRTTPEENMLLGALVITVASGVLAAWMGGLRGAIVMVFGVGVTAAAGKVAFDSIVQRDAPDASHGASFGRFETRFQIAWVIGGVIPVLIRIPVSAGFALIALASFAAALSYFAGSRGAQAGRTTPRRRPRTPRQALATLRETANDLGREARAVAESRREDPVPPEWALGAVTADPEPFDDEGGEPTVGLPFDSELTRELPRDDTRDDDDEAPPPPPPLDDATLPLPFDDDAAAGSAGDDGRPGGWHDHI